MKHLKYHGLTIMSLVALSANVAFAGLTIHNGSDRNLCFGYFKTKATLKSKVGLDKDQHKIIYDDEVQGQEEILPIGTSAKLKAYASDSDYDRVVVIPRGENCAALQNLKAGSRIPDEATVLEVGSKTNVVIVSDGPRKFKLKTWTKSLEEDLDRRRRAMYEALNNLKLKWDDLQDASEARWKAVSTSFKKVYEKLKKSEPSGSNWRKPLDKLFDKFNIELDKIDIKNTGAVKALAKKVEAAATLALKGFPRSI